MPRAFFVAVRRRRSVDSMLEATPIHPEGPRYGASLVFLPGLWAGPDAWRPVATYLGHRGWQGALLDLRPVRGGLEARALAVADYVAGLGTPAVLVGHDAGALVALAAAARRPVAAIVLVAPLVPGTPRAHALTWSWSLVWTMLAGGGVGPPSGALAERAFAELSPGLRAALGPDDPRLVARIGRGYEVAPPDPLPPALLVHG